MSVQKSQLTYSAPVFTTDQTEQSSTSEKISSFWASFSKRFWDYTEETSKSDTSSFKGLL